MLSMVLHRGRWQQRQQRDQCRSSSLCSRSCSVPSSLAVHTPRCSAAATAAVRAGGDAFARCPGLHFAGQSPQRFSSQIHVRRGPCLADKGGREASDCEAENSLLQVTNHIQDAPAATIGVPHALLRPLVRCASVVRCLRAAISGSSQGEPGDGKTWWTASLSTTGPQPVSICLLKPSSQPPCRF